MTDACLGIEAPPLKTVPHQDRPVGWYRDQDLPSGHRYWDGREWRDEEPGA